MSAHNFFRHILLLLCLACLLIFAGCQKKVGEMILAETEAVAQTEEKVQMQEQETTVIQIQDESEIIAAETQSVKQAEVLETDETELLTDPESVSDETEMEPAVLPTERAVEMIAKEQYTLLEKRYQQLEFLQKESRKNMIAVVVAAVLMLVVAVAEPFYWIRREKNMKKRLAHKRCSTAVASSATVAGIAVGKVHGIGKRDSQQDCFAISNSSEYLNKGVFAVVADGMGGMENGEKASQTAVMAAMNSFLNAGCASRETLVTALAAARSDMEKIKQNDPKSAGGTTLLAALLYDGTMDFVSVGDSRICLYRNGILTSVNREHSYQQELLRAVVNGECTYLQTVTDDRRGCIACYLGMGDLTMMDIPSDTMQLMPGDKVILMSDGVYNALNPRELCLALQYPAADAAEAIKSFIHSKNFPDQDNFTAVILECA